MLVGRRCARAVQLFVYPDAYSVHGPWAVCLLYLIKYGAGAVSLDYLISRRFEDGR